MSIDTDQPSLFESYPTDSDRMASALGAISEDVGDLIARAENLGWQLEMVRAELRAGFTVLIEAMVNGGEGLDVAKALEDSYTKLVTVTPPEMSEEDESAP
jgi:hypothetical protein